MKTIDAPENMFESASECLFITDPEGSILRTSLSFEKLLGYEKDTLTGIPFMDIIHVSESVRRFITFNKLHHLRYASETPMKINLKNRQGKVISVILHTSFKKDAGGKLVEIIGMVEKAVEDEHTKITEEKTWETREMLQSILANSGDAILVADAKGCIILVNKAVVQMLGYREDELIGMHLVELTPFEGKFPSTTGEEVVIDDEYHRYNVEKTMEMFEKGKATNVEFYFTGKDKRIIPVETTLSLLKDQSGEIRGSVILCRDITERKKAEKEIREARDFLENIFKTSVDGILVSDESGYITLVNHALEKMTGYSKDELVGKHTSELRPPDEKYRAMGAELKRNLYEDGFVIGQEMTWLKKDGSLLEAEVNSALLKNNEGTITGGLSHIRDITEKKKATKDLMETRDFLNNIFKTSADAIMVSDAQGFITMVNEAAVTLTGYAPDELIGKHSEELSAKGEPYQQRGRNFITLLLQEGFVTGFETRWIKKDARPVEVEINIALLKNGAGATIGSVAIVRNITERKRSEQETKEARDFLENVIKTSVDGIIITDARGHLTMVNEAVVRITGFSQDELIGKHAVDLSSHGTTHKERGKEFFSKLYECSSLIGFEDRWVRKDQKPIEVEINAALLKDHEGTTTGSVASIRDITEKKEFDKVLIQSEKLRSLGELAGGVAHDFNNILAAILGRVQLLKNQMEPPTGKGERRKSAFNLKKGLEVIEKASLDGAETVRRIQKFSKKADSEYFLPLDVNEIIDDALEFTKLRWKNEAESKGIIITIRQDFTSLPPTLGNAPELRELFTNLISNAVDAMPQGGEIRIKTFTAHNQAVITIEDTGIGIPEAIHERIFDPFFTTKGLQSTGLGLSVSYGIINRHQGTIKVNSVESKGTTFTIRIPLAEKIPEKKKTKAAPKKYKKAHILVIEDDKEVAELLHDILRNAGHQVEVVHDGFEGIKAFKKKKYDLVFSDLGMPKMSGWQVAKEIKDIDHKTPVAIITGWQINMSDDEVKKSGVDLVVNKPFQLERVLQLVEEGMKLKDKFKKY